MSSPDVLVLCYHAVGDDWPSELSVETAMFERQVRHLLERGYTPKTFSAAVRAPAPRTLAITFDDAYVSVLDRAFPVLRALGAPATVFAPVDHVGTGRPMSWEGIAHWSPGPHAEELVCMDWEQLALLQESGWEVGSHTCSHPHLPRLPDAALADELTRSRERIEERLRRPCESVAYPYGDVDHRVVRAAAAAGYTCAAALPKRLRPPRPLHWPRIGIYRGERELSFRTKVSPGVRRARAALPGGAAPAPG